MKFLLGLLLLVLFSSDLHAAVVHVQSDGITASGQVASLSIIITVTGSNAIAVGGICYSFQSCDVADNVWSDDRSNSYVSEIADVDGRTNLARAVNVAAGITTVTLTPQISDFIGFGISEFSGVNAVPTDATSSSSGLLSADASIPITSTSSGVLYAVLNLADSGGTITPGASWNEVYEDETFIVIAGSVMYRIAAAGSYNCDWTSPAQSSNGWFAACMSLKEAAAVAGRRPIAPIIY